MKNIKTNSLSAWLFKIPALFAVFLLPTSFVLIALYALITSVMNTEIMWPLYILLTCNFLGIAYYFIKKMHVTNMYQSDFVAITNGYSLISIAFTVISIAMIRSETIAIRQIAMWFYIFHRALFLILTVLALLVGMYLIAITAFSVYTTYKRAIEMGVSKLKTILSWPFGFFLLLMPGYLQSESKAKSNVKISSHWYKKFNDWVLSNNSNLIFTFIVLILLKNVISGWTVLIFTTALMIFYLLWNVKFKSSFMKNINKGYATSAIAINIISILMVLINKIHPIIIG